MLSHYQLTQRLKKMTGKRATHFKPVQGGYTAAQRLIACFSDGSSAFVKVGTSEVTSRWLRQEHDVYQSLSAPFMPAYLGWDDDGEHAMLLLEDLSHAFWPPPWSEKRVQQVLETLEAVSSTTLAVPPLVERGADLMTGWSQVAKDPQPFLSLALVSERWLEIALPILLQKENAEALQGDSLLHLDVRSDNICFVHDRVVLIDWDGASYGNALVDIAAWLPSLHSEGGPLPEHILPNAPELATLISGYFACKAGLPSSANAPYVREVQKSQLNSALPWVIRALELPPADGRSQDLGCRL